MLNYTHFPAPKVVCLTKVYHPNICMTTGRVYIAILGKDWRPVLTVNAVLLGLQVLICTFVCEKTTLIRKFFICKNFASERAYARIFCFAWQLIFLEPNPNFPVNPECCEVYKHDPALFRKLVSLISSTSIIYHVNYSLCVVTNQKPKE